MTVATLAVEEALLVLKIVFLVLLYLFIWRIVRSASRDLRLPQESFIMKPQAGPAPAVPRTGRLVVLKSPALPEGSDHLLDSAQVTVGRGAQNDLELASDDFTSSRHARFDPRRDGVWIEDIGSTNGTYVNGRRIDRARKLAPGDVVRVGATDFRFER